MAKLCASAIIPQVHQKTVQVHRESQLPLKLHSTKDVLTFFGSFLSELDGKLHRNFIKTSAKDSINQNMSNLRRKKGSQYLSLTLPAKTCEKLFRATKHQRTAFFDLRMKQTH